MAIDFPNSPSPNQVYTVGTTSWIYSNSCWELVRYGTVGPTGPTGSNGAGLWTVSDTAPTGPSSGSTWYNSTTGKTYVYYDSYWVEVGNTGQITTSHSNSHINGGGDVIDGDRLQLDYVPTNYTRNSAATGATDARDLTAHLSGLDTKAGTISSGYKLYSRQTTSTTLTVPYSATPPGSNELFPNDLSFTANGISTYIVQFGTCGIYTSAAQVLYLNLCTGSGSMISVMGIYNIIGYIPVTVTYLYTPPAGTVTLNMRPHKDTNTGSVTIQGGTDASPYQSNPPPAHLSVYGPIV